MKKSAFERRTGMSIEAAVSLISGKPLEISERARHLSTFYGRSKNSNTFSYEDKLDTIAFGADDIEGVGVDAAREFVLLELVVVFEHTPPYFENVLAVVDRWHAAQKVGAQ